ncbi:hypothetical protein FRC11_008286 [Ceratobasidium sp. 423]|nr:hypothetical protein FRC11_008286 [Ceratobasidium sp. 423]
MGHSQVKAYDVQHASSCGTVWAIETTVSKVSAARPIQFAGSSANAKDSNQFQALQFDDAQHMLPNTSLFQAVMHSNFEQLYGELEAKTEDVANTYVHTSKAEEGQNEMLCEWSDTWSQSSIDTMPAQKEQHVNVHIQAASGFIVMTVPSAPDIALHAYALLTVGLPPAEYPSGMARPGPALHSLHRGLRSMQEDIWENVPVQKQNLFYLET